MFLKNSVYLKLLASARRANELQEILCPCEQHDYVLMEKTTDYPYMGGQTVEVLNKRKLICTRCKKVVFDYRGCGKHYQYTTNTHD